MGLTEILIVYFSFGAPVLVAFLVTKKCTKLLLSAVYAVAVFVFWPVFGATFLYQKHGRKLNSYSLFSGWNDEHSDVARRLEVLRLSIEGVFRKSQGPTELYRWRSEFDRYVSIALALGEETTTGRDLELLKIVQHPDPDIASACRRRKMFGKLSFQQSVARSHFLMVTYRLCSENDELVEVEQLLLSLALLLNDGRGEDEIRETFAVPLKQNSVVPDVSNLGSELWHPQI
jgi:hypothetical protein